MKPSDARSASFNPQHAAYNPTSHMANRSAASMDARAAAFNPQHKAFTPKARSDGMRGFHTGAARHVKHRGAVAAHGLQSDDEPLIDLLHVGGWPMGAAAGGVLGLGWF